MPKLVTIGDSLTQGFQHLAIRRPKWSYPAMVARVLNAPFDYADFTANGDGGPILDLEVLSQSLGKAFGKKLDIWETPGVLLKVHSLMSRIEDYWERGDGTKPSGNRELHHNLAVWGFEVLDALTLSHGVCMRNMPRPKNNLLAQVPEYGMYRTASRVFNPLQSAGLEELTQMDLVGEHAKRDPIENLLVALGSNNVLGTCTQLKLRWSHSSDFRKLAHQRDATIWEPEHFTRAYDQLVERIKHVAPTRVFLATVPHVTIPPVTRGVSPRSLSTNPLAMVNGYFEYYTRFWIWDDDFDPSRDDCFRREDAIQIDQVIDEYNQHIMRRADENGWTVVHIGKLLDDLAFRRQLGKPAYQFPAKLLAALKANAATAHRVRPDGTVLLDTRFFRIPSEPPPANAPSSEWQEAYKGGLFGLDGVHPTTVGYGLVAHEVLRVMQSAGVVGADPLALPWDDIVAADTLLTATPPIYSSLQNTLDFLFSQARLDRAVQRSSGFASQPIDR